MMRLYLISAQREYLMTLVYNEIIGRQSFEIQYKTEMRDGTDGLYIKVADHAEGYFKAACKAYGVSIRWNEKEAA